MLQLQIKCELHNSVCGMDSIALCSKSYFEFQNRIGMAVLVDLVVTIEQVEGRNAVISRLVTPPAYVCIPSRPTFKQSDKCKGTVCPVMQQFMDEWFQKIDLQKQYCAYA